MNTRKFNVRHFVIGAAFVLGAPLAAQAQSNVYYQGGEAGYPELAVTQATKSRADVQAEVQQARRDGTLDRMQKAQSPTNRLITNDRKSRSEVVNEMRTEQPAQRAARQQLMVGA